MGPVERALRDRLLILSDPSVQWVQEPPIPSHAHDLSRCREPGIAWWADWFLCQTHIDKRVEATGA